MPGTGQLAEATYSPDYFTARERFRLAARTADCELESHSISARGPQNQQLTIDVALSGSTSAPRAVVVSSGLHGVEGFLGSAVQLAMLPQAAAQIASTGRLVLLHAINPFGFAYLRRCNANNVDLNRNFLLPGEPYSGVPPQYAQLDGLLNPRTPPARWCLQTVPLLWALVRRGYRTLARTLPVGQYQFPQGLFYGGDGPAEEHLILAQHLHRWIGAAAQIVHLDLHTGLGRWGQLTLLVDDRPCSRGAKLLRQLFTNTRLVTTLNDDGSISPQAAYASRGSWNRWAVHRFADRTYAFATVELGTYSTLRIASALRTENRAWHYGGHNLEHDEWSRRGLAQVFAPPNLKWRHMALCQAWRLAMHACAWAAAGEDSQSKP